MSPDILQDTARLLRCPPSYLKTFPPSAPRSHAEEILVLARRDWLEQIDLTQTVPHIFPTHPDYSPTEIEAFLSEARCPTPGWSLLTLKTIPLNFKPKITRIPNQNGDTYHDNLTLPEIVQHINQKSFKSICRSAESSSQQSSLLSRWEEQLLDQLVSIYGRDFPVLRPESEEEDERHLKTEDEDRFQPTNFVQLHCVLLTDSSALLLHTFHPTSVLDMLKYSPAMISEASTKYLFILYQILEVYKTLRSRGICFGDSVSLDHFKINETLQVLYDPPIILEEITKDSDDNISLLPKEPLTPGKCPDLELSTATARWCSREMTNLEYLLTLNREAGRVSGQPNNHPVLPWVSDFSSQHGPLRDLTKSKFRLNKGDLALDLTYESGQHHVTEVLSEITYYTYKSRVTDKAILCKYVRPSWVPEEYPSSIQR